MSDQFTKFQENLQHFAERHKNEIKKDVAFRQKFQQMCANIGVDPLACRKTVKKASSKENFLFLSASKGFWSEMLGVGDFYYELAVQIVEICVATSNQNGGLISLDELLVRIRKARGKSRSGQDVTSEDILRAIKKLRALDDGFQVIQPSHSKARTLIQSIPGELSTDHLAILNSLENRSSFTAERLSLDLKWSRERIDSAINFMIKEGLVWVDQNEKTSEFYFPGLFTAQNLSDNEIF